MIRARDKADPPFHLFGESEHGLCFLTVAGFYSVRASERESARNVSRATLYYVKNCPSRLASRFGSKQPLLYRFDTSTTKLLVGRAVRRLFYCLLFNDIWQFDWSLCGQPGPTGHRVHVQKKANNTITKKMWKTEICKATLHTVFSLLSSWQSHIQFGGPLIDVGIEIIGLQRLIIIHAWIGESHKSSVVSPHRKKREWKPCPIASMERKFLKNRWARNARAKNERFPHMPPADKQLFHHGKKKKNWKRGEDGRNNNLGTCCAFSQSFLLIASLLLL